MNRLLIPLALIVPIALISPLAACATHQSSATPTLSVDAIKAFVVAESGFDATVETADVAIKSGKLPAVSVAKIKALVDTGHTYVVGGRAAVQTVDAGDLVSETAALTALMAQIAAITKG